MKHGANLAAITALLLALGCKARPPTSPSAVHPHPARIASQSAADEQRTPPDAAAKEQAEIPAWIREELGELSLPGATNGQPLAASTHVVIRAS